MRGAGGDGKEHHASSQYPNARPLNAAHLRRVLRAYVDCYNKDRLHLALAERAPNSREVEGEGEIVSWPRVGGLHHRYGRVKGE